MTISVLLAFAFVASVLGNTPVGSAAADTPSTSSEDQALLLVSKQLLNKFVVENMDVVIKYNIFNVGSMAATNIRLKDSTFGPDFKVVGGHPEVTIGRIPPQANATHTLVVRPLKFGYYNFTAAQVSYTSGDDSKQVSTLCILYKFAGCSSVSYCFKL